MELSGRVAVVALTASGGALARRIAAALGDADVHGLRERVADADEYFSETAPRLRALFEAGRPVVGICAAGILVRALAPILVDKRVEPPVIAVSDDGAFAVPLLGGHRGGVELAGRIAQAIGAAAAVTTAGDRRFRIALDRPPEGWTLANPHHCKPFVAALLEGAGVRLRTGDQSPAAGRLSIDARGVPARRVDGASPDCMPDMHVRRAADEGSSSEQSGVSEIRSGDGDADRSPDTVDELPAEDGRCIGDGGGSGRRPGDARTGDASHGVDEVAAGSSVSSGRHGEFAIQSAVARAGGAPDAFAEWLGASRLPIDAGGRLTIRVDDRKSDGTPETLIYHPRRLAVGIGCERGAAPEEVAALARACLDGAGLAFDAVAGVFSVDVKSDEPALHAVAETLGVPARFFCADTLEAEAARLRNPSELVFREVGCHGVAEGAALAAAGPYGELVVEKTKSMRATCAIARAPSPIAADSVGSPRGELYVVGIGPGDSGTMTPAARAAIERADHVVGYRRYLDLVANLIQGATVHPYALGEERDRVAKAIGLGAGGTRVALVCSGDPGVYAMASLVMEMLDGAEDRRWGRIAVGIVPGVSALQAAAARAGAPIGHDFCAVSLSDLLTPRAVIEARLAAAAAADFVIALYNPVSASRLETFERALGILRRHRAQDTPVVVARNLGRSGERVSIISLGDVDPARIDMMTVLLVGSSKTRSFVLGGSIRVYTPRGYGVRASADVVEGRTS